MPELLNARFTRRTFLQGCSAAIAAMAGSRLSNIALAAPGSAYPSDEILLVVFLRGGWDALNAAPPIAGPDRDAYVLARPYLKVPASGAGAALPLNATLGLHPGLAPLHSLYQAGKVAVVHAAGLQSDTRSHFDAMQFIELGTPGNKITPTGWLSRHLSSVGLPSVVTMPAVSASTTQPASLLGNTETIAAATLSNFNIGGNWYWQDFQRLALRNMYIGDTWLHSAGSQTLDAVDVIESANPGTYTAANGAVYPGGSFGDQLKMLAQLIKMEIGVRVATVDIGGWDTHESQGDGSGGYFASLMAQLGQGLAAFYTDLDGAGANNFTRKLTVVTMSEFGRRLRENDAGGTDHGHGSAMFVMGGNVNGGQVYGAWPGLANNQLYDNADLAVTTDYRQVLSEIVVKRLANPSLDAVFPSFSHAPWMNIVRGLDVTQPISQAFLPGLRR